MPARVVLVHPSQHVAIECTKPALTAMTIWRSLGRPFFLTVRSPPTGILLGGGSRRRRGTDTALGSVGPPRKDETAVGDRDGRDD